MSGKNIEIGRFSTSISRLSGHCEHVCVGMLNSRHFRQLLKKIIQKGNAMKKTIAFILSAALILGILPGCGEVIMKDEATQTKEAVSEASKTTETADASQTKAPEKTAEATKAPTKTPTATPTPTPKPTSVPLGNVNPFTGEAIEKDISSLRPYAFMCNNISVAVPHCGVSQADIIMEMMDEGGITRMMVFFADCSDVPVIGSIRSARAYNIDTALGYDAFLVHCGCSDEGDAMIAAYGMEDIDQINGRYGPDSFYRDPTRAAERGNEHSLMAVGSAIANSPAAMGYRLTHPDGYDYSYGLSFSEDAVSQCVGDATQINVTYAGDKTSNFTYNPETGTYTMYQYGEEYTDDYKAAVPFANVIMIYANTYLQSDGLHLTIDLTNGNGFYFTGGRYVPILWYKDGANDVFHFTLEDGTPLQLSVGKTFVAVNQCGSYQGSTEFS